MAYRKKKVEVKDDLVYNAVMEKIRSSGPDGANLKEIEDFVVVRCPELPQAGQKGLRRIWAALARIAKAKCALKGEDELWRLRQYYGSTEAETPTSPEPEIAPVEHVYREADVIVAKGGSTVSYKNVTVKVVLGSLALLIGTGWYLGLLG